MDRFGIEGVDVFVSIFFLIFFGGWNRFEIFSFFFLMLKFVFVVTRGSLFVDY